IAVIGYRCVARTTPGPDALDDPDGRSPEMAAGAHGPRGRHGHAWGNGTLCPAPGVRHGLPHPAGLGPPIREAFAGYPAERLADLVTDLQGKEPGGFPDAAALLRRLTELLEDPGPLIDDAGPEARAALDALTWGPPVGRVADARRPVRVGTADTPIERLLARGLLAAEDHRTVTLPR